MDPFDAALRTGLTWLYDTPKPDGAAITGRETQKRGYLR